MTDETRRFVDELRRKLDAADDARRAPQLPTAPIGHRRLCVVMATFDDFDGVYFTVSSLLLGHPEVRDQLKIVVLDNHPEGAQASLLHDFCQQVPEVQYVPFRGYRSTAVRDLAIREADADIVCCLDSHVLVRPGGLAALLRWFDEHPDSVDLVQGPLLRDDARSVGATHFDPGWRAGMYGMWGCREGTEVDDEPFEIEMMGLGLFACRTAAWPGINPRFRGFGGEEGYVHEQFRLRGGRVLCLPALAWLHRFHRPSGVPYDVSLTDRVRNYHLGWREVGWDTASIDEHFSTTFPGCEPQLEQARRDLEHPLTWFDGVFCLNLDSATERWAAMTQRLQALGVAWRAERFPAIETPDDHHVGCARSWRAMIATAARRGYEHVLVFEDDAIFLDDTVDVLARAVPELARLDWDLAFLGAAVWGQEFPAVDGSEHWRRAGRVTCTHALAVHRQAYDRLLAVLPDDDAGMRDWITTERAIDQYLARAIGAGDFEALILSPRVATQLELTAHADSDAALAERYTIR